MQSTKVTPIFSPPNIIARYDGAKTSVQEPSDVAVDLSVIIPVCNEEDTIQPLYDQLVDALTKVGCTYELIFIDDGSTDTSYEIIKNLWINDSNVRVIKFARNYGKTPALSAGHDYSRGRVILHIDADLQNDPQDIPRLLEKIDEGYDVVSGWRKKRHDELFLRLIPSWIANRLISRMTGVKLSDYGCCLKAYRREVIRDVRLYGEMHRFVPIYASWLGAKVVELPVIHHPRRFGKSKYGISRTGKVVLDLITVFFMSNYLTKPIYVFGSFGLVSLAASFVSFVWMLVLNFQFQTPILDTPLPVVSAVFMMTGVQLILMGLMAELLIRTYFESQSKLTYNISTVLEAESFKPETEQ